MHCWAHCVPRPYHCVAVSSPRCVCAHVHVLEWVYDLMHVRVSCPCVYTIFVCVCLLVNRQTTKVRRLDERYMPFHIEQTSLSRMHTYTHRRMLLILHSWIKRLPFHLFFTLQLRRLGSHGNTKLRRHNHLRCLTIPKCIFHGLHIPFLHSPTPEKRTVLASCYFIQKWICSFSDMSQQQSHTHSEQMTQNGRNSLPLASHLSQCSF